MSDRYTPGTELGSTNYNWRRATITSMIAAYGESHTKTLVHHKKASDTINTNYSNCPSMLDIVASRNESKLRPIRDVGPAARSALHP